MGQRIAASVIIPTKNRIENLRVALRSTVKQSVELEIIVMDDGSTDGTQEMVRDEFPSVKLHHTEQSLGPVKQRNHAAKLAISPLIISLDDDSEFSDPNTVEQTLKEFNHPRIGAVAIPYIDVNKSKDVEHQRSPEASRIYAMDSFVGAAHAFRRDIFNAIGGYKPTLLQQGEERDYCVRMLQAGYVVRCGNAAPIHHHESPIRDFWRMDYYGSRNLILFSWHNAPTRMLPVHLLASTIKDAKFGFQSGRLSRKLSGLMNGYMTCLAELNNRHPVSPAVYWLNRELRKQPLPLDEIERRLPVVREVQANR